MLKRIFVFLLALCTISCGKMDQMQSDIDRLTDRVDDIETALKKLQTAYDAGKIITAVEPYADDDHSGWKVTFSDNTSITILNGKEAITPIISINPEGYWMISYDNGETFNLIADSEGNNFTSKGEDGISVRVAIADDNSYIIELYKELNPDIVIDTIETPLSSDPSVCISSIVKDELTGVITIGMADGTLYDFNLYVVTPTGVIVLAEELILTSEGEALLPFRVNPSNAVVDLDITQENPMIELDMVIENASRSYVTVPDFYKIAKVEAETDADGNIKEGQYVAHIVDLGEENEYCQGVCLVLNTKDAGGDSIQISSNVIKVKTPDKPQFTFFSINGSYASELHNEFLDVELPYGSNVSSLVPEFFVSNGVVTVNGEEVETNTAIDFSSPVKFVITSANGIEAEYIVSISYSNLPVVYINTKDDAPIVSKDDWLKETEVYITNAGEYCDLYLESQIKGRGNTTWNYPKKPYAIKLDKKKNVLGMPKHKRWVLLANYVDKTCIRNSIAFAIAETMEGLEWTPRGRHVDVVLNGQFLGNYYLCEQIKVDEERVNIAEMESTDIDAESITGGYLLEIDKNFDEVNKFYSPIRNRPFMIKDPDEDILTAEQFTYIQNYVTEIENALYGEGMTTEDYLEYIDLDSFIDYWLVYELTGTGEPTHPKSVYMYKDRGSKMHAGPVWDFDYFTFQPYYNTALINTNAVWNDRIINDPATQPVIKERWNMHRDALKAIGDEINRQYEMIKESADYNSQLWPLSMNVNKDDALSVADAVARMHTYYMTKFEFMDGLYKYQ